MNFFGLLLVAGFSLSLLACKDSKQEDTKEYSGDKFKDHIRTTEARSPEEERLGFKLPDGFEVTLYASEPDIGKPINIAFDAKGRVWVTQSFEYPFPSQPGKGKDKLTILEDTNGDGKADRFTNFSDTLNIPIGVLPMNDGAVVYSIPNVYRYTDANGDGKLDGQKKLFGPFKTNDTHGMINNLVRGYDGWIHSCHGYSNRDTVAGGDGDSISMISGNTFRFRPDGSRVEKTTDGRINPFGLVYDERAYMYSTDCHTSPLYQLIRDADYTQWGKEEGMGFAPEMTPLTDEATALAGISYYADVLFPEKYRSNFFVGDVVRCRVYQYSHSFTGSTPVGKREEDFMLSDDPWFRPVDVKMGPDGALYIADFYNSIIGHYEVPLDHPKRDHIRGRIWRITYKDKGNKQTDWTSAPMQELLQALDTDNMFVRMTAADQVSDRIGKTATQDLTAILTNKQSSTRKYIHALWILYRLGAISPQVLQQAAAHADPIVRLHAMRILAESGSTSASFDLVENGLKDKDPHVRRAAVELLPKYPEMRSLKHALQVRAQVPEFDTHLLYASRLSLRNLLRNEAMMKEVATLQLPEQDAAYLADVSMGVPSYHAGVFLFEYVKRFKSSDNRAPAIFQHIARYAPYENLDTTVRIARNMQRPDTVSLLIFKGIRQGIAQRGQKENKELVIWGRSLAENVLRAYPFSKDRPATIVKVQTLAADIAGNYKLNSVVPDLEAIVQSARKEDLTFEDGKDINNDLVGLKVAAAKALIRIDLQKGTIAAQRLLNDKSTYENFKSNLSRMLGEFPGAVVNRILKDVKNASPELQTNIAVTLAGTAEGKDILFAQVKNKEMFPRTLLQPRVMERIMIGITPAQKKRFEELTSGVSPIDQERQEEISKRVEEFEKAMEKKAPPVDSGRIVFVQQCSSCHSMAEEGGNIGPNLDGVSQWGAKSLAEKILDPNRNISENFRTYTVRMNDGKVVTGLYRRDEGAVIVFADLSGKEFSISKKEIAEQTASKLTLMPDNFRERLSREDFNALIHYLLNPKGSK